MGVDFTDISSEINSSGVVFLAQFTDISSETNRGSSFSTAQL